MQINESFPALTAAKAVSFPKSHRRNRAVTGATNGRPTLRRSARGSHSTALDRLTPREFEVLVHLSKGLRYKEIMDHLGISQGTLHFFIRNLYAKLRVHSRTEAVMKLVKQNGGV
jgi:DNA-binding CsgD family transcriptional regulator